MARSSGSTRNTNKSRSQAANKSGKRVAPSRPLKSPQGSFLDEYLKRDLRGIGLIILAVVLFVLAVTQSSGYVAQFASSALHLCLGLGAYFMPFFVAAVGCTFFIRFERALVPARVALGLCLLFVAILSLLALSTPFSGTVDYAGVLFKDSELASHGGYIGAGIAWLGLTLFGVQVSCVIMAGVAVAGVCIIGFSITKLIERIRQSRAEKEDSLGVQPPLPFGRVKRQKNSQASFGDVARGPQAGAAASGDAAATMVIPANPLATRDSKHRRGKAGAAPSGSFKPRGGAASADAGKTIVLDGYDEAAQDALDELPYEEEASEIAAAPTMELGHRSAPIAGKTGALTRALGKGEASGKRQPEEGSAAPLSKRKKSAGVPAPLDGFELPSMELLSTAGAKSPGKASESDLQGTAEELQETLDDFGIYGAEVKGWVVGPTVTLFKIALPRGVRVSRVTALSDDIALALAAPGVRIFAPIPGTNYVGIEVPNKSRQTVHLRDVLEKAQGDSPLLMAIGEDVEGTSVITDLAKMPHLLIGGTTGSGKSVAINAMIMSILMRATPSEVRFIMIDPKRVEFTPYNDIPHLIMPVVTEPKEAAGTLQWGVREMELRLKLFSKVGVRNIGQFNAKVAEAKAKAEETGEELDPDLSAQKEYIVIIIDELADLMMNVGKEVESAISRIAQLARAAGIHLIVATQRPSTNVVTGLIKANITNRIAFNVASGIDSRVILDTPGAEHLIGLGDMLFSKPEFAKPQRIQACFVSEDEISAVVSRLKEQGPPNYDSSIIAAVNSFSTGDMGSDGPHGSVGDDDPLLREAAQIVVDSGFGSTSNIQRRLKVGYSRAGRIMDQLEEHGIVGPANGSKPREVLVEDALELETLFAFEDNDE